MERYIEMKKYIEYYRCERINEKRECVNSSDNALLISLLQIANTLIQNLEEKQAANEQGKIKYLIFHRILSSEYTGSYEISVEMSNAMLYLDEHASCTYWKPEVIYRNLEEDMR